MTQLIFNITGSHVNIHNHTWQEQTNNSNMSNIPNSQINEESNEEPISEETNEERISEETNEEPTNESTNTTENYRPFLLTPSFVLNGAQMPNTSGETREQRQHQNSNTETENQETSDIPIPVQLRTEINNILQSLLNIPVDNVQFEIRDQRHDVAEPEISIARVMNATRVLTPTEEMCDNNGTCAICHGLITQNTVVRQLTQCEHFFHNQCLETWFSNHDSCPVCRARI